MSHGPDLGCPTGFGIDYREQVVDEEPGTEVTEAPVPVPCPALVPPIG